MALFQTADQILSSGVQPSLQGFIPGLQTNQTFGVQYVANTLKPIYVLTMVSPSMGANVQINYVLPISPQSLTIQRKSLSAWYETQGSSNQQYVNRIIDLYGLTPMIFTIRGTTGFNRYSNTGYSSTGIELMKQLQKILEDYFSSVQSSQPSQLQWLDYFYREYWEVVPIGPINIRQDASRPLWMYYELTLAGTHRLNQNQYPSDPIQSNLAQAESAFGNLGTVVLGTIAGAALLTPFL